MTEQEIRDNAPDGATHYAEDYDGIVYLDLMRWGFCYSATGTIVPDYELKDFDIKPL